jgi:hypothetical protein
VKEYPDTIREYLQCELANNAVDYLRNGLNLFHNKTRCGIQVIIGNLAIAIELMLKALITEHNPLLLFKELPLELKVLFACPGIKTNASYWRRFDIDLRSFTYKTIELDECISIFYILFSEKKQLLQPYFRFLSNCRNTSIHASLPSFQRYDLERTVYLALNIQNILRGRKAFRFYFYNPKKEDNDFLNSFDTERVERVRKNIEGAKKKSKDLTHDDSSVLVEGWEAYTTRCPVCKSEGVLGGYTDLWIEATDDSVEASGLSFFADSFECMECGLILDDVKELALAGLDDYYDRASDLDKWLEENQPDIDSSDYNNWS